jgi:peptidoglycan hydrolase CwlO-like protein
VLNFKERAVYILSIIFLAELLFYFLFSKDEDYVVDYNSQINNLENKIDSLHGINSTLNTQIKGLNDQISSLDNELILQDNKIFKLKKEVNEKINDVDFFNDDELEQFFTDRYRQYLDSIRKKDSETHY